MTISKRRATTVFNRFNFTITDIIDFSDPTPTIYDPNDFFTFYEIIFAVNETSPQWWHSTQYMFLLGIVSFLGDNVSTENGTGSDDRLTRLQEFLVTPTFLFNNVVFGGPLEGLGTSASLAMPSYRVILIFCSAHCIVDYRSVHTLHLPRWWGSHSMLVFSMFDPVNIRSNAKHIRLPGNRHCSQDCYE